MNGGRAVETLIPVGMFGMLTYPGTWAIPHTLPNKAFKWLTIGFASAVACFCWIGHFVSSFRLTKDRLIKLKLHLEDSLRRSHAKKQMGCEISGCYRGPGTNSRGLEYDAV
jgi:hypothetical protein